MIQMLAVAYCLFTALLVAGLLAATALCRLQAGRRKQRDAELAQQYLRIVLLSLASGRRRVPVFPRLRCAGARHVLAGVLVRLTASTYGLDPDPLRRIVKETGLTGYLLRRARRTRGCRRAWYLSLLSRLPADDAAAETAAAYAADPNRYVRFYALMVQLAADPSVSLKLLAAYPDPLTAFELAEIMAVLRRGVLPVAYEPLVDSSCRNLRSLGLCIVRQFGIEEAEDALLRIAEADDAPELGREAVYTLCALQRPLGRYEVAKRVKAMSRAERKSLLRYMALEGYAGEALTGVFSRDEAPYFEALVHSYKRPLVCS